MKVKLFDFQKDALQTFREKLQLCKASASASNPQAIVFSAPTGSGKTIMATALFEAILDTPDEQLEWPSAWGGDPSSVILWLSYSPDLNEQTRLKIESKSDRIYRVNQLVTLDASFDAEILDGGRVYFLNVQKLANGQPLTRRDDGRTHTIWETLANTAKKLQGKFFVVIDEAHQGMAGARNTSSASEASSLVQRFLLGAPDVGLPKMPIVIGVSATPQRFTNVVLAAGAGHTIHAVTITPAQVRESGLLKDRVLIHYPKGGPDAEMTLLEEAARQWSELASEWESYCRNQSEPRVWPVLVVQVENSTAGAVTKTDLSQVLNGIERAIGRRLSEGEVVHAITDAPDLDVEGRLVRRVDAPRIDADKQIGVVVFKTALSTGWDCPRAEVMMSFRAAQDSTYVAQLLGRMVRTPLARRVENSASLNDVHLYLPHFDKRTVGGVLTALQDAENVPPTETGTSDELVVLNRAPEMEKVFDCLQALPTYKVNAVRSQSSLRRYVALARALTKDEVSENAWATAQAQVVTWLDAQLARMMLDGSFAIAAKALNVLEMETKVAVQGVVSEDTKQYQLDASEDDIERRFEEAGRRWGNALHVTYWRVHEEKDSLEVKVVVAVLSQDAQTTAEVEAAASAAFDQLYDSCKHDIGRLSESKRSVYTKLRLATATPQTIQWELPPSIGFRRAETAPVWEKHVYLEDGAVFKAELKPWEEEVIRAELAAGGVVGWLRNIDRKPWAFEIPYRTGGEIRPMFPDMLVVREKGSHYVVDVLEPHDPSLSDNYEKAIGMAEYCERHGERVGRMELIRKQGATFRRLDLNKSAVQAKVKLITTNAQLDAVFSELGTP